MVHYNNMDFKKALFISFLGHCCIAIPLGHFWIFNPREPLKDTQVTYFQIKPPKIEPVKVVEAQKSEKAPVGITQSLPQQANLSTGPTKLTAVVRHRPHRPKIAKKINKVNPIEVKPQVNNPAPKDKAAPESIPGTTMPNTPSCLNYYYYIREQIRRNLEKVYNPQDGEGEVAVTFVLTQAGELAGVKIIEEKSSPDPALHRLSYASLKGASPFKPFPKGLSLQQISFNLTIVFKKQ